MSCTIRRRPRVSLCKGHPLTDKATPKALEKDDMGDMGEGAMPMGTGDARAANYRPMTTLAESCAHCCHFMSGGVGGLCSVIAGPIRPDFVCDAFMSDADAESESESEDMGEDEGGGMFPMEMRFEVSKSEDPQQTIFGWASVAIGKDGATVVDSQGDTIDPADLEKAAYEFVLNFRETDQMHTEKVRGYLIESFVVTPDKLEAMGLEKNALPQGWWTGFYIPDRGVYENARDHYPMFSIAGVAIREEVES